MFPEQNLLAGLENGFLLARVMEVCLLLAARELRLSEGIIRYWFFPG
jgi:hypothetical protein